ncbi:hypothetical protein Hdeb2414_s0001g00020551 [Helianthus debilis subsp. tardiflorus]
MVTTLGTWKNRLFWVSDSIVPFKMVWRHPDAVLNEPEPSESNLNEVFLKAIRECPSRVRPFPEHLLVLLGVSKLWDKANRDLVLMRNGQVMSAMDFIKSDDTSDVVFADAQALKVMMLLQGVWSRDLRMLAMLVFEGQDVDVEKEKKLVVHGKKKAYAKKVVMTHVQGSSSKDIKNLSEDEVYVPDWSVKVGDSFKDPNVCANVLAHFAPP